MATERRKFVDCRESPSVSGCSLRIAGSPEEVERVAARHAIEDHGHEDTPELRAQIRKDMKDEPREQRGGAQPRA